MPNLKIFDSGYGKNPFGIEWMRYVDDAPYPELVKTVAHMAYEVDELNEATKGKHAITGPNSPSRGVLVAMIEDIGAPVELIQIDRKIAEDGS